MSWLEETSIEDCFELEECAGADAAELVGYYLPKLSPDELVQSLKSFSCFDSGEYESFMQEVLCEVYKHKDTNLIRAAETVFKIPEGEGEYYTIPYSSRVRYKTRREAIDAMKELRASNLF